MEPDTVYRRIGDIGAPVLPMPEFVPPLPRQPDDARLFPPRFGYNRNAPTLLDVFSLGRSYADARYNVSGPSAGTYSGSSVNMYAAW